jgi:peptidoglycan/LPS O-acetylase OafA/YrhL
MDRSYSLDVARALAIVMVLVRHGYVATHPEGVGHSPTWLSNLAANGWLGVDLFFVLSGFLLSHQLIQEMTNKGQIDVPGFWRRRLLRILPCYLAIIVPAWLVLEYGGEAQTGLGHLELLVHLVFLQDYAGSVLLVPSWSLATEMKFYLLLPLLVWLGSRMRWRGAVCFFLLASLGVLALRLDAAAAVGGADWSTYFWHVRAPFHLAIDGLLLGLGIGYVSTHLQAIPRVVSLVVCLMSGALVTGLLAFRDWSTNPSVDTAVVVWLVSTLFALAILFAGALEARSALFRRWNWIVWLARISYPLYLVHYLLLPRALSWAEMLALGQAQTVWVFWTLYLGASVLVAWVVHRAIEVPFLALRDRRARTVWALSNRGP